MTSSRRNRVLVGAFAASALLVVSLTAGQAAQASGTNIVASHGLGGSTYLHIAGTSTTVTGWDTSHGHSGEAWLNYCGFRSKAWGTLSSGSAWSQTTGINSGCIPIGFAGGYTGLNVKMKSGTTVKGQSYHDGTWAPGIPQVGVWA
ncbi:hypothetical protein [Microbacterium sp. Leaf159]|uniref:hypothetical protein n=1 Tax=Microbacterium sp. Leaf159 TaxID=1736279 RepID=UPI0007013ED1|nr:hypothetical protein [Microbacterium sp. Leaf159]KQR39799.1 hypothetical protein ASF80_10570 [Microbacterium sp. Leaf159]